jgi:hypothetical protein
VTNRGRVDDLSPLSLADELINNPGRFFFDVHTASNANGVARGRLAR